MAAPENATETLPQVVLLRHPSHFLHLSRPLPSDFHFLKPWESPLPLHQFLSTHGQSAQALLTSGGMPVTAEMIRLLPSLRLVVTTSAGLNHIDLVECRQRGIAITSAGDVYSDVVAELAVGLLIDVWRKVSAADRYVRQGRWLRDGDFALGSKVIFLNSRKSGIYSVKIVFHIFTFVLHKCRNMKLRGKRVGIVGLGRIGFEVAKRLKALGCIVLYTSRKQKPSVDYPFYADIRDLASNSDALIICCGLTEETCHMIDKEVMEALGKEGVIVNIGRGPIIDEKEMVERLVRGELCGAGLDVFENEPSVPKELRELDSVVLSPHTAVITPESVSDLCDLVVGNLRAFFAGKPLLSPILQE